MPRGSYVKSFLTTSVTAATTATTSSAMNVPLMAAGIMPRGQAAGIQIWSIDVEWDGSNDAAVDTALNTTANNFSLILSTVPVTGEKFVNDRDVLWKRKIHANKEVTGKLFIDLSFSVDFYPAVPFYGQQLHFALVNTVTGATITAYCKVWYSLITMSSNEVLAQLQNQLT